MTNTITTDRTTQLHCLECNDLFETQFTSTPAPEIFDGATVAGYRSLYCPECVRMFEEVPD